MAGPGMELIGEEEKQALLEVIEAGYLFRYGSPDNPAFKARVYPLLASAINIGIGVSDPGLGSAFGVTIRDTESTVDQRVEQFRKVVQPYL